MATGEPLSSLLCALRSCPSAQTSLHPCTDRNHEVNSIGLKKNIQLRRGNGGVREGIGKKRMMGRFYQNALNAYTKFSKIE